MIVKEVLEILHSNGIDVTEEPITYAKKLYIAK